MALLDDTVLVGPPPSELFDPVPPADLIDAFTEGIPGMLEDVHSDTRNLVLTLARIWCSVITKEIHPKDVAAGWALARLPPEHQAVLARARNIYLRIEDEHWEDLRDRIRPFADAILAEIEAAVPDRAHQSGSDRPETRCRVPAFEKPQPRSGSVKEQARLRSRRCRST